MECLRCPSCACQSELACVLTEPWEYILGSCNRAEHLPALLSPTFLRCVVNALAHADAHLHAAARRLLDRLVAHAAAAPDPNARVAVAVALQRCSGGGFDRLTGTRTAAQLLQARPFPPTT